MMRLLLLAAVVLSGAPVDARKAAGQGAVRAARHQALGAAHLVRGPVRLIHHKNLKHPHTLCKLVNANVETRVVVGATACAMHDVTQIRVRELRDGSPWLD